MDEPLVALFAALAPLTGVGEEAVFALAAVFTRVGAMAALLPGFGERTLPTRIRLAGAVAFTLVVWPAVAPDARGALAAHGTEPTALATALAAEALVGLALGLAVRLLVMAMQLAGSIAAQATSVAQILGAGATPDPMPAIGGILTVAAIALAMTAGLHVQAAAALVESYGIAPLGRFPAASDIGLWGVAHAARAFALAFSLAAPFVIASFAYNLALGAINRAMPQLMVAFVGAPAITAAALVLLWAAGPSMLARWQELLVATLAAPLALP